MNKTLETLKEIDNICQNWRAEIQKICDDWRAENQKAFENYQNKAEKAFDNYKKSIYDIEQRHKDFMLKVGGKK